MLFNDPLAWVPAPDDTIDRHPLIVSPDTSLQEVVALIQQSRSNHCLLETAEFAVEDPTIPITQSSCVLVVQDAKLVGIFTERDIVRLTAAERSLDGLTIAEVMTTPVKTLSQTVFQDIFAALFLLRRYRIRHLPILDHQNHIVGVVSSESIRRILRPANLLRLRRVGDVMVRQVFQASPQTSVLSLARSMAQHQVSCIVITETDLEGDPYPVGIVTERDIVQFQALQINLAKTQAKTVMSTPLFLLSPEASLWTAHQEMQRLKVGRLVVSWNWGRDLGIITQTNLLRIFDPIEMYKVIENLQSTIQQLQGTPQQQIQPAVSELDQEQLRTTVTESIDRVFSPIVPTASPYPSAPDSAHSGSIETVIEAVEPPDRPYTDRMLSWLYELNSLLATTQASLAVLVTAMNLDGQADSHLFLSQQREQLKQAIVQLNQIRDVSAAILDQIASIKP